MATPAFSDLFVDFQAEAQDRRADLTFDEGDICEMLGYGGAAMADHVAGYSALRIAATYLDGASGDDLTALADDHWNIQRLGSTTAVGSVAFSRASAAAGAGTLRAGFVLATVKDSLGRETQVITDVDVSFGATDLGPFNVTVTSQLQGTAGNVAAGQITRLITQPFDSSIIVTNASSIAGGSDPETDDALRDRVRNFAPTIRRGTLAALEYGAKTVPGVANATAAEDGGGIVNVYVSDSSGGSNQIMIDAVSAELENWRAAGTLVQVFGGTIVYQPITVTLSVRPGVSTAAMLAKVQAAVANAVNKGKIGETLEPDTSKTATKLVDPDGIISVAVDPAVAVTPLPTQLIRTTVGMVTVQ